MHKTQLSVKQYAIVIHTYVLLNPLNLLNQWGAPKCFCLGSWYMCVFVRAPGYKNHSRREMKPE